MGSLEIPSWVGPVLTPILLILFIVICCFYYCYWKPRRKQNSRDKECGKHVRNAHHQPCQIKYVDDSYINDNSVDYSYGVLYTEICPLPVSSSLAYCKPKEFQPTKVFYYPKRPAEIPTKSCKLDNNINNDFTVNSKFKKCKVKCPKGHCMKCPDLPIIMEGESFVEEEELNENTNFLSSDKVECNCNVQCSENASENGKKEVVVECETGSDSSNGSSDASVVGHDSGYED